MAFLDVAGGIGAGVKDAPEKIQNLADLIEKQRHTALQEHLEGQQIGMEQQKLAMAQKTHEQDLKIKKVQAAEAQAKFAEGEKQYSVKGYLKLQGWPDQAIEPAMKRIQEAGFGDVVHGDLKIKHRQIEEATNAVTQDINTVLKIQQGMQLQTQQGLSNVEEQMQSIRDKSPGTFAQDEKYQKLMKEAQALHQQNNEHDIQIDRLTKASQAKQAYLESVKGTTRLAAEQLKKEPLPPERVEQEKEIKAAGRRPEPRKLLTPEEEAQQIRIAGAKEEAKGKAKAKTTPLKIGSTKEQIMKRMSEVGYEGLSASEKQVLSTLNREDQFVLKETISALRGDLNYQAAEPEEQAKMRDTMEKYIRSKATMSGSPGQPTPPKVDQKKAQTPGTLEHWYQSVGNMIFSGEKK